LFLAPVWMNAQSQMAEPDTIFLDSRWKVTKNRENARYWRQIVQSTADSMLVVHDYWISTGHLQMVGTYRHEMKPNNQHGRFHYYYENGTLKAIYDYHLGIIHGELKKYYRNGNIKSIEHFDLGTKVDTTKLFWDNGQLRKVMVQNPNFSTKNPSDKYMKTILIAAYSKQGETEISGGEGVLKEYFLSGRLRTEIDYENGFPHGKWIKYSGHKRKKSCVMTFKHGRFIKGEIYDNGKKDIFSSLQRKAYFPTGMRGLEKFIDETVGRCQDGFSNEVILLINISTQGKVSLDQILSGNTNACQYEEIQNLINNMPLWVPAINNGQYVEGSRSIKLNF
jgi:antitoxin component YwqK of YwqJK toxin-antitoxin module